MGAQVNLETVQKARPPPRSGPESFKAVLKLQQKPEETLKESEAHRKETNPGLVLPGPRSGASFLNPKPLNPKP